MDRALLESWFAYHGTVWECEICHAPDTGFQLRFGFVEMADEAEAEKAVAALDGAVWEGRVLRVEPAKAVKWSKVRAEMSK
jgi:RNA recognition motif-containing protein